MKVLFLTTHLNTGGITQYLLSLSKEMVRQGHQIYLASGGGDMAEEFSCAGVNQLLLDIHVKSEIHPKLYGAILKLRGFVRSNSIDIIHANTRVTQVMGRILGLIAGVPYVSTCHGFYKLRWFRRFAPCWGRAVIAISPTVQEHLEKDFQVKPEKISYIRHGLDIGAFPPIDAAEKEERRKKYPISGNPVIGIIARLADVKGHDILIRAMPFILAGFPQAKLVIVGEGKQEKALVELVRELNLGHCVDFFPVVKRTRDFLSVLDIFVLPSLSEGLGLSAMEAQAAGLPVVASRVGGLVSLIEDGKTGFLVEPQNPVRLAETIMNVARNPKLAQEVGSAAREYVAREHSAQRMARETAGLFEKILAERR